MKTFLPACLFDVGQIKKKRSIPISVNDVCSSLSQGIKETQARWAHYATTNQSKPLVIN